jgi:hypothetical protein
VIARVDTPGGAYTIEGRLAGGGGRRPLGDPRRGWAFPWKGNSYEGLFVIADIPDRPAAADRSSAFFDPSWNPATPS